MFEPFDYQFFVRGLIAATLVGGLCGMIGVYIVLKRMAYIGHGLSHAVLGGAVVSFVLSINFLVGATVWGFFCAQLIALTAKKKKIASDAAIGVITTASFALGIVLISRYKSFTRDFEAALFGNILGVSMGDLAAITVVTLATVAVLFVAYKHFLFATFDGEVAQFYGIPTGWVETLFSLVLAATIVVSMQVLGVLLIAGATVIPPVAARMVSDRFQTVLLLSTGLGAACGFVGIYISYFIDVSSGASVVLVEATVFALVMAYTNLRPRRMPDSLGSAQPVEVGQPNPGETD